MKQTIQTLILTLSLVFFTACGGGDDTQNTAINKFIAYAQSNGSSEAPTLQDYIDAGVGGVTEENLAEINELVENLTRDEVDTTEEIQAIVNEINVNIAPIARLYISSVNVVTSEVIKFTSNSTDVDGNITKTLWTIEGSPDSTNLPIFYYAFGEVGTYKVTLLVEDDDGATNSIFTIITVSQKPTPVTTTFTGGTFKGKTYQLVTSIATNRIWLDRNLGASQVCTTFDDVDCYGDYYQWGRNTDGHEKLGAGEINTQPTSFTNLGSNFIRSYNQYSWDWAFNIDPTRAIRDVNWDICPVGFRIADYSEFVAEFDAYSINNRQDAFESFLALPSAGMRPSYSVDVIDDGFLGSYWTDDTPTINAGQTYLTFNESDWAASDGGEAASGRTIRCIQR